jgi:putative transposase
VSNTYQKTSRRAQPDRQPGEIAVPERVIVSMAEIAESAKEGLLALAVGTGLQVMAAMFAEDAGRLCGPDGGHNPDRAGYRHGSGAGSVTLGGRRVPVTRPRVQAADGSGELHLPSYDLVSGTEVPGQMAMEKMLAGLSSRRYPAGLVPAGQAVESAAAATSKSAVSHRFVAATETALEQLMSRRLDGLDLVVLTVDGMHFGEHTCVTALGIGIDGTKHPLAVEEGSTENATLVTDLITDLRERGLDVTRPILAVLARTLHSTNPGRVHDRDLPGSTPRTSSGGGTGRWRCAGAPRGCSKPITSSAASTAACTCRNSAPPSTRRSPGMLHRASGQFERSGRSG